jgi:hypothetical protein
MDPARLSQSHCSFNGIVQGIGANFVLATLAEARRAMRNTKEVWRLNDAKERDFAELSDRAWGMPELNYQEYRSAAEHAAELQRQRFKVTKGMVGLPTTAAGEAKAAR